MRSSILAVDDSASMRRMVSIKLTHAGLAVVEAVDGVDGLDKAQAHAFDPATLIEVIRKGVD